MTDFLAHRVVNGLQPMDAHGIETVRALPLNTMLKVQVSQPRNPRHHRLFWALASLVHENLPDGQYPTVENFVSALKLETGVYTEVMLSTGEVVRVPGSISFASMDQTEFARFFDSCCNHIIASYWPSMTSDTLRREVAQMTGFAPPDAPAGDAANAGGPATVPPCAGSGNGEGGDAGRRPPRPSGAT